MIKKAVNRLKDNSGFADNYISMLVAVLTIIMVLLIGFAGYDGIHKYSQLNVFADQMAQTTANTGKTSGTQVDKRYNELVASTGLRPTITYSASYYNSSKKTVQYGETINLTVKATIEIHAFGDLKMPLDLTVKKSAQSQQYWK